MREEGEELDPNAMAVNIGMDMGIIVAGWLTEWERTGNADYRDRILQYMTTVGELPFGFFSTGTYVDIDTGIVESRSPNRPVGNMSHLNMVFGYPELAAELIQLFDVPGYRQAWLQYCQYYNADRSERSEAIGVDVRSGNLSTYYSRLTAFAAYLSGDEALARRAWNELLGQGERPRGPLRGAPRTVERGPESIRTFEVGNFMSTNWVSEWNIAMIQTLRFAGEHLDEDDPRTKTQRRNQPGAAEEEEQ